MALVSVSQIGSAGRGPPMIHLRKLTNLRELDLEDTLVTGAGLAHLQGLVGLQSLSLRDTQITDAGLVG